MTQLPLLTPNSVFPSFSPQQQQQGSRPSQVGATMDKHYLTEWNSDLCSCGNDMNICCSGVFLCPCMACDLSHKLGHPRCLPMCDICSPAITTCCALPCCVAPALLAIRGNFRTRYGIKGTLYDDIVTSCFCVCCAWCQLRREFKYRETAPPTVVYSQPPPLSGPVVQHATLPLRPVGFTVASY